MKKRSEIMITKVEGIVISEQDYSESSKIINVITKEYGKIGIIAKGSKKMKSSLRGVSGKLTYGYFHIYYKKGKLSDLISVDIINNLRTIKSDIIKISYVSYLVELVDQIMKEEFEQEIYDLLISTILKLEEGYDPLVMTNILELKLLDYLGVRPIIDCCALCGNNKTIATISSDKGGYICLDCLKGEKIVSDKAIKLIRMFYYVDIAKITKLEISDSVKKEIDIFINEYYEKYTGLYLKTKTFLNNLLKL
jgi:DNA repair protein RecO (recombination protein O)